MVVFLPFIGLYLAAKTAVGGVTGAFSRSAQDLGATITPGWAPGAAHMTGKATDAKKADEARRSRTRSSSRARQGSGREAQGVARGSPFRRAADEGRRDAKTGRAARRRSGRPVSLAGALTAQRQAPGAGFVAGATPRGEGRRLCIPMICLAAPAVHGPRRVDPTGAGTHPHGLARSRDPGWATSFRHRQLHAEGRPLARPSGVARTALPAIRRSPAPASSRASSAPSSRMASAARSYGLEERRRSRCRPTSAVANGWDAIAPPRGLLISCATPATMAAAHRRRRAGSRRRNRLAPGGPRFGDVPDDGPVPDRSPRRVLDEDPPVRSGRPYRLPPVLLLVGGGRAMVRTSSARRRASWACHRSGSDLHVGHRPELLGGVSEHPAVGLVELEDGPVRGRS